jgi:hypothetical protein
MEGVHRPARGQIVKRLLSWISKYRLSAVLAGVGLVAVPTFFTTFTEATEWPYWIRGLIVVAWLIAATIVVMATVRQDLRVAALVEPPLARRDEEREFAAERLIRAALTDRGSPLAGYDLHLFVLDQDADRLLPIFEEAGWEGSEGWEPGRGATGLAYQSGEFVKVQGEAVSDGSYGLGPEQQARYRHLQVVAAMPVKNARNEVIAVLTASRDEDDGLFDGQEGFEELVLLGRVCARILIDVLQEAGD